MRDVKTLTLKGLNSRDTIHNVEDGWCDTLHNVAFREGKFQTVCEHQCRQELDFGDYKIKYVYPILPEGDYIVVKNHDISHAKSHNGVVDQVELIKRFPPAVDMDSVEISHFESTLFMTHTMDGVEYQDSFIYNDDKFTLSEIDTLSEFVNVDFIYDFNIPPRDDYDYAAKIMSVTTTTDGSGNKHITDITRSYETRYAQLKEQDYLHGSLYIFFAYKMKDGSILCNGRIYMIETEEGKHYDIFTLYRNSVNANLTHYYKNIIGFKVRLNFFNMATTAANKEIKSIVVYSTRNNPLYNFQSLHHDFPTDPADLEWMTNGNVARANAKCVRDKRNLDIASSPFYAVAEVDFRSEWNLTLSASLYENIEQKPIFTPTVSAHRYRAKGSIELNRRRHLYNITAQLYKSSLPVLTTEDLRIDGYKYKRWYSEKKSEIDKIGVAVTLNVNGENVVVNSYYSAHIYLKRRSVSGNEEVYNDQPYVIIPNILSYPDARAIKMDVFMTRVRSGVTETLLIKSYDLQPAAANNYATYRNMNRDLTTYYELFIVRDQATPYTVIENKETYRVPNQVMVSEVGRPHLFYPQHVYYVGSGDSTRIENANTPIDQLTESRFGQYPLYLFTTSGIYAMEQSAEMIYNNIVKVNTDIIKRGTNSVSAYGALYYFSSAGLMRLNGHLSSVASDVINAEILKFMENAILLLIPEVGELMIINKHYNYAYLYSLRSGVWSRRDFTGEVMSYDTYIKEGNLYDLLKEDASKPLKGSIETRELLLGSRQIKRLDRFKADILTAADYAITIMASLDGVEWCELAKSENCDSVKRTVSSWKYYKVKIEGTAFVLDNLLFESFTRFVRHIR